MSSSLAVLILAAGKGTRMKSDLPKVLHPIHGRPMLEYVIETAEQLAPQTVIIIVGHQAPLVQEAVKETLTKNSKHLSIRFALQSPQLGTGHAVMQAEGALDDFPGDVLVLSGDAPLITAPTLQALWTLHREMKAVATILTAVLENPTGYGRIIRDESGQRVLKNVEQKDATESELSVKEINSGIYLFEKTALFAALKNIRNDNAQQEYYLPDVIKIFVAEGKTVSAMTAPDATEIRGINTPEQLAEAAAAMNV